MLQRSGQRRTSPVLHPIRHRGCCIPHASTVEEGFIGQSQMLCCTTAKAPGPECQDPRSQRFRNETGVCLFSSLSRMISGAWAESWGLPATTVRSCSARARESLTLKLPTRTTKPRGQVPPPNNPGVAGFSHQVRPSNVDVPDHRDQCVST